MKTTHQTPYEFYLEAMKQQDSPDPLTVGRYAHWAIAAVLSGEANLATVYDILQPYQNYPFSYEITLTQQEGQFSLHSLRAVFGSSQQPLQFSVNASGPGERVNFLLDTDRRPLFVISA